MYVFCLPVYKLDCWKIVGINYYRIIIINIINIIIEFSERMQHWDESKDELMTEWKVYSKLYKHWDASVYANPCRWFHGIVYSNIYVVAAVWSLLVSVHFIDGLLLFDRNNAANTDIGRNVGLSIGLRVKLRLKTSHKLKDPRANRWSWGISSKHQSV